ncbi:15903_t:CDS:2 [Gigaspora rosea]|nr:15903_t:CDS:2 [Gigaspora rosea]
MAILEDNDFNCEEHLPPKPSFKQTDLDHCILVAKEESFFVKHMKKTRAIKNVLLCSESDMIKKINDETTQVIFLYQKN